MYVELLDDYDFLQLDDAAKWHYIGLLLLASKHENKIPEDMEFIRHAIGAKQEISLSPYFLKTHVLASCKQTASKSLASCKQSAIPETETETETETEKKASLGRDAKESASSETDAPLTTDATGQSLTWILDRWNAISGVRRCKTAQGRLVTRLNGLRQKSETWWMSLFTEVGKSRFLTGQIPPTNGRPPFRASLWWATGPENVAKILAGNYDDSTDQSYDPIVEQSRLFLQQRGGTR